MPLKTHSRFWTCCRISERLGWRTEAYYHG